MKKNTDIEKELKAGIILQLLYSDIFQHPLTREEITSFLTVESEVSNVQSTLDELVSNSLIQKKGDFYFVFDENGKISHRKSGSKRAVRMMPKANKIAQFIHKFPFIEGVAISGSLSKGVLHDDADFDFFIITKPERLWVARTVLVLYKKVFLLNSRKFFCVNYFVDSNNLEIEEKNWFTAVEISTLIPLSGDVLNEFYEANKWASDYFPNSDNKNVANPNTKKPIWSRSLRFLLNKRFGDWADTKMMNITLKRWNKKFGEFNPQKFDLTMKSRKYISKHHPNDFQSKVLMKHKELISRYKNEYQDKLIEQQIEV